MHQEAKNKAEAVKREQCIELLKAILTFDADERITPSELLALPFITKDYPNFWWFFGISICSTQSREAQDLDKNIETKDDSHKKKRPHSNYEMSESSVSNTESNTKSAMCEDPSACEDI